MKHSILLIVTVLFFLNISIALANENSDNIELLVKYKDEYIQILEEDLLEPKIGVQNFRISRSRLIIEDYLPELGVVKYGIPSYLDSDTIIMDFIHDEMVHIVATNDIRVVQLNDIPLSNDINNLFMEQEIVELLNNNPLYYRQWALQQFNISMVWKYINIGCLEEITVAVLDTGIDYQHDDLKAVLVNGYNYIGDNENPVDDNGHGTAVSGIIAAENNDIGIVGVAPGVKIMPVKILNNLGKGDVMTEIKGIIWAVDNGANIINLSLSGERYKDGVDTFNTIEYAAIQYAINRGVIVVAAVGNNMDAVSYPAAYPDVIAVTSVDRQGEISIYANYGPEVSIAAPGEDIWSTYLGNTYIEASGTSVATPFITGIAALLLANNKELTPFEIKQLMEVSSVDKGSSGKNDQYGYGIINPLISIILPVTKIQPSISNMYYPNYPLDYLITMDDLYELDQSDFHSVYSNTFLDLYNFDIDFSKSYKNYYYGSYDLLNSSVVDMVYGKGEYTVLLNEPGFYELRSRSISQEYAGSREKFTLFPESPTADYSSGNYSLPIEVTLVTSTSTGSIYYTTNGESPLINGRINDNAKYYNDPIRITNNTVVNAITVSGRFTSTVATYWYGERYQYQPIELDIPIAKSDAHIIENENYIIEILSQHGGYIYNIIVKDQHQKVSSKLFEINLGSLGNNKSSYDTLQLSKDNLAKLAKHEYDLLIELANFHLIIPHNELAKLNKTTADFIQLDIAVLQYDTAVKALPLLQVEDNIDILTLASSAVKINIKCIKEGTEIHQNETIDFIVELYLTILNPNNQEEQWNDFRKTGVFVTYDGMFYEYVGGELDSVSRFFKIKVSPMGQILFILENKQTFQDIQKHWAKKYIEILASKQIVEGGNEMLFRPDDMITRAEFTAMLVRELDRENNNALYSSYHEYITNVPNFIDVPETIWYYYYIERAKEMGLVNGIDFNLFEPERLLTREEAFTILMRIYKLAEQGKITISVSWKGLSIFNAERSIQTTPTDMEQVSDWAKQEVQKGLDIKIVNGYLDGAIRPQQELTRAEASTLFLSLFEACSGNK